MDQKNTIVKCKMHPNCLFNHNGICDNYVISIGADGSCQEYIETASEEEAIYENTKRMLEKAGVTLIETKDEVKRGQRAKCNVFDDMMDINDKHLGEAVTVKIPDPKDMDIRFTIQNAQWNEEFLRDQMCWYCDNGFHGSCKLTAKPSLDRTGKCPKYTSTGGNR